MLRIAPNNIILRSMFNYISIIIPTIMFAILSNIKCIVILSIKCSQIHSIIFNSNVLILNEVIIYYNLNIYYKCILTHLIY